MFIANRFKNTQWISETLEKLVRNSTNSDISNPPQTDY